MPRIMPGAEILLDALGRRWRRRLEKRGSELDAMRAVVLPRSARLNELAGGNRRRMAENGDQIALTPRLHPQYAEPVLLVVEGDALHQATEDLGRCAWLAAPWWRFDPSATYHACEPRHRSVRLGSGLLASSQWECSARWYFRKGRATRLE